MASELKLVATKRFAGVPGRKEDGAITGAMSLLFIMAAINFINYVDRSILTPLVPALMESKANGGLGLSQREVGLLGSAFMWVHSLASIPLGLLADRLLRKRIIAAGVTLWSVATAGAALAGNFAHMLIARAAVGIGEAAYAPAATALISERFPAEHRARALGIFNLGMFIGGAVGITLGGVVAKHWGWRAAFLMVGLPGLVLALLVLAVAEKRRRQGTGASLSDEKPDMTLDPSASHSHTTSLRDLKVLLKSSSFRAVNIIGILITFFVGALNLYAVQYLKDVHHIDPAKAGPIFGGIAALGGLGGVFFGSYLADRLTRRGWGTGGRLAVIGAGMVLATPFIVAGLLIGNPIVLYPALGFGVFFTTWYIGPILAALHDVVPAYNRAAATGAYFFLIHMLGDALSPIVVAEIKTQTGSLKTGMLVAVAVGTLGGIYALLATRKVLRRKLGPGAKS
ncbi:MAG: MFS transporter [Deltaproteobacteria bacterium]|nr:MFS transporter [Deltaproteobacteria bacterium]